MTEFILASSEPGTGCTIAEPAKLAGAGPTRCMSEHFRGIAGRVALRTIRAMNRLPWISAFMSRVSHHGRSTDLDSVYEVADSLYPTLGSLPPTLAADSRFASRGETGGEPNAPDGAMKLSPGA
jgi:hypothetical protein